MYTISQCSVLQCVAVNYNLADYGDSCSVADYDDNCVAVCCIVADYGDCVEVFTHSNSVTSEQYQRVAVCCVAVCCVAVCCVAVCCNVRFDH